MIIIHESSDGAILAGWTFLTEWRSSRNALLLFDALARLNEAERSWTVARAKNTAMRREWQVLRRCVMRGLARLHQPLLEARSPSSTERALYTGSKRATAARTHQLNERAINMALVSAGTIDGAAAILEQWGLARKRSYLKKRASQLGLTKRKRPTSRSPGAALQKTQVEPGRTRYKGIAY